MRLLEKILSICLLACLPQTRILASGVLRPSSAEAFVVVSEKQLRNDVEFLASEICQGRSTTQRGGTEAATWSARRFGQLGLMPFDGHYSWGFSAEGHVCQNVIGMLPTDRTYSKPGYVIIGAHYDNIGSLDGKTYPGADSNASGMAAMLGIADMFRFIRSGGGRIPQNMIFVAFDAKQLSLAGSYAVMDLIEEGTLKDPVSGHVITKDDITLMVNLDILGSTASPIHNGKKNYMLMLGGRPEHNDLLRFTSYRMENPLDLGFDYYGSKGFTDMFLNRVSDQRAFLEKGIYSVLFTSGITMDVNKTTDTVDKLDFAILKARVCLICRWVEKIMNQTTK